VSVLLLDPIYPTAPVSVPEPWLHLLLHPGARVFAFLWGLLWGSFTNVVIYRTVVNVKALLEGKTPTFSDGETREFWKGRSRCPHCEHPIASYDNIPVVSFLLLRGKCRHCKTPLSLRYLVVELLGGLLSFALFMQQVYVPLLEGHAPNVAGWLLLLLFGLTLLSVTFIDLDVFIIPNMLVWVVGGVGLLSTIVYPDALQIPWQHGVAAAVAGFSLFGLIHLYYIKVRGLDGLGLGDAHLLLMVGVWLGPLGLAFTIFAGAIQGLLVSVPMLLRNKPVANADVEELHGGDPSLGAVDPDVLRMQRVPFGPFLAMAAMEFVLLRRSIEALLTWWTGGAL
jgi:leader peptidase (prepilin peptidase)/N-methyltransferase